MLIDLLLPGKFLKYIGVGRVVTYVTPCGWRAGSMRVLNGDLKQQGHPCATCRLRKHSGSGINC